MSLPAAPTIEPYYCARLAALGQEFKAALSRDLGSDDLAQVARAAAAGRIATLLIDADREIPGRLDEATGAITLDDWKHPQVDDLLDDLGDLVAAKSGLLLVVPATECRWQPDWRRPIDTSLRVCPTMIARRNDKVHSSAESYDTYHGKKVIRWRLSRERSR